MNLELIEFRISDTYTIIVVKCRKPGCRFPAETSTLYCRKHEGVKTKKRRLFEWLKTLLTRSNPSKPDNK